MKTPASRSRVSGDMNAPDRLSARPPLLWSTWWRTCASILDRIQSMCLHLWFHCGVVENARITWWFQATEGKASGGKGWSLPMLYNQWSCPMGKEKPVPPLPASSHDDLHIFVLSRPLSNTQTWFHYPSKIRGYSWSCWGWIFLANLYKTSAYKYMLISVHCKTSPTTRSGVESRWCPLSAPGIDP